MAAAFEFVLQTAEPLTMSTQDAEIVALRARAAEAQEKLREQQSDPGCCPFDAIHHHHMPPGTAEDDWGTP